MTSCGQRARALPMRFDSRRVPATRRRGLEVTAFSTMRARRALGLATVSMLAMHGAAAVAQTAAPASPQATAPSGTLTSPAQAGDTPSATPVQQAVPSSPAPVEVAPARATDTAAAQQNRDIVVTGSRVATGFTAPTPVTTPDQSACRADAGHERRRPAGASSRLSCIVLAGDYRPWGDQHRRAFCRSACARCDPHARAPRWRTLHPQYQQRHRRSEQHPDAPRIANRGCYGRRIGRLWIGRGRRRHQFHPRYQVRGRKSDRPARDHPGRRW